MGGCGCGRNVESLTCSLRLSTRWKLPIPKLEYASRHGRGFLDSSGYNPAGQKIHREMLRFYGKTVAGFDEILHGATYELDGLPGPRSALSRLHRPTFWPKNERLAGKTAETNAFES